MTDTYIDTTIQTNSASTDAFDMPGSGDTLLLGSAGSLIALGATSDGLLMEATGQNAILQGTVYSAQMDGVAMWINDSLTVYGTVIGVNGITLGSQDAVIIDGQVSGSTTGVFLDDVGSDSVTVNGMVSAVNPIVVGSESGSDVIRINGTIDGTGTAGDGYGLLLQSQRTNVDIGGGGSVTGATDGISEQGANDTIRNDGHVTGGLVGFDAFNSSGVNLVNNGTMNGLLFRRRDGFFGRQRRYRFHRQFRFGKLPGQCRRSRVGQRRLARQFGNGARQSGRRRRELCRHHQFRRLARGISAGGVEPHHEHGNHRR